MSHEHEYFQNAKDAGWEQVLLPERVLTLGGSSGVSGHGTPARKYSRGLKNAEFCTMKNAIITATGQSAGKTASGGHTYVRDFQADGMRQEVPRPDTLLIIERRPSTQAQGDGTF
jgi:hypothetical protein